VTEKVFCDGVSYAGDRGDEVLLLLFEGPMGLLAVGLAIAAIAKAGLIFVGGRDGGDRTFCTFKAMLGS